LRKHYKIKKKRAKRCSRADGQIATEDAALGTKVTFGSLLDQTIQAVWNAENYNLHHHFEKWTGRKF
jgi:hypothetical protein